LYKLSFNEISASSCLWEKGAQKNIHCLFFLFFVSNNLKNGKEGQLAATLMLG